VRLDLPYEARYLIRQTVSLYIELSGGAEGVVLGGCELRLNAGETERFILERSITELGGEIHQARSGGAEVIVEDASPDVLSEGGETIIWLRCCEHCCPLRPLSPKTEPAG
jgi:hypothetical protein